MRVNYMRLMMMLKAKKTENFFVDVTVSAQKV